MRLDGFCAGTRIVDHNRFDVVVLCIFLVQHGLASVSAFQPDVANSVNTNIRNIWHVVAGVTLSCDVHPLVMQAEGVKKIFEEPEELLSDIGLVLGRWFPLGKASSDCSRR